jgi:hypothetical protein
VEHQREHSACRLLMIIECFSVSNLLSLLCHSSVGTSIGSCAPCGRSYRKVNQVVSQ